MWIEPVIISSSDRVDWRELEEEEEYPFFILEHYDPVITHELDTEEDKEKSSPNVKFCYRILLKTQDNLCIINE
jgi:hypothetical protein